MVRRGGGWLGDLYKRDAEHHNGRLNFTSGTWRFVGNTYGKVRADGFKPTGKCHTTGRDMELVICKGVFCYNPEMDGTYPMITDPPKHPMWNVPEAVCRKCTHRGKRGESGLSYPFCKWAKETFGGTRGAAKAFLEAWNKAVEDTKRIMGQ